MSVDGVTRHGPATIHEWFQRQAAVRGDAEAVTGAQDRLSYRELDRNANQLAHHLRGLGVGPEMPVAVCLSRTPRLIVALLAVLKAGAAYLPLDPSAPDERLAGILADAGARILITDTPARPFGASQVIDPAAVDLSAHPDTPPEPGVSETNLAYVIYTSGSTGKPKGVMVEHRNVTALLRATRDRFRFGPQDVWSLFFAASFDFAAWEMWGALTSGGRLAMMTDHERRSPEDLHALLVRERVTVLNQTPAAFRQTIAADQAAGTGGLSALRVVILGGEVLPLETLRPWFARYGDGRPELINMYGITETTVHSTLRRITLADLDTAPGSVIGPALPEWTARVLAADGTTAADGEAGEFVVGGAGVARGYLGRPGLTAERFVPDPHAAVPGTRRYRSGDSVRRLPDGDHVYLGRMDHQVKIRGYRVEPGEIEVVLSRYPGVRAAIVLGVPDNAGDLCLAAYYVGEPGRHPDEVALRAYLRDTLPEYMVPSVFVPLEALPLTVNGKVDRAALPAPGSRHRDLVPDAAAPNTPMQKAVAEIWAEALSVPRVGLDDDFFELGGHSMLAARVVAQIRERVGVRVTLRLMFDLPTVRELADALEARDREGRGDAPEAREPGGAS